jgi:hypothetical protein
MEERLCANQSRKNIDRYKWMWKMTIEQRVWLLHILYKEWTKGSQTLERDVLMRRMNVNWDTIRHEVAYLEENKYIEVKRQHMGVRIFERIGIATKGIKLVEDGLATTKPQSFQASIVHNTSQIGTLSQADVIDNISLGNVEKVSVLPSVILQHKIEGEDFDVFLCYHVIDKSAVKRVGERLKERGILPWLDEWELRPGLSWLRILEEQIRHIKSAAVFVGKEGIGPWQRQELDALLHEFVDRRCPVIPVLLEDTPKEPQLPLFLKGITWVDFRKQDPDPIDQLVWGITGERSR